jgi:hypothetical protein
MSFKDNIYFFKQTKKGGVGGDRKEISFNLRILQFSAYT